MEQNTTEWLDQRKAHIGASDAPIIMGVSPYKRSDGLPKTPYILWKEKLGILPDDVGNSATQYGKRMEGPAREAYESYVGTSVSPKVIYHPTIDYMMASLDGISDDGSYMVEIKNTNARNHFLASEGKIPIEFWPQLVHQMACANRDKMHYWSWSQSLNEGVLVEVKMDKEYLEELLSKEKEFWKYVQKRTPPPLCEKDYISQEEGIEEARKLVELRKKRKEIEAQEKKLEEHLRFICQGERALFGDVIYGFSVVKGRIKYNDIPELQEVDLELYRTAPYKRWEIDLLK